MLLDKSIRESGGTGRRARLRGVWIYRTGSSPVSRTIKTVYPSGWAVFLFLYTYLALQLLSFYVKL